MFSGQLYAVKLRLHVALVGDQLVAATKPAVLHQVIDLAKAKPRRPPVQAHALFRLNRRAIQRFRDDLGRDW